VPWKGEIGEDMRMDVFERLNEEQKVNCMEQFIKIYGVDEFMESTKWRSAEGIMESFECGLDENGYMYPPDDACTLEELADEIVVGYTVTDATWDVGMPQRRQAFNEAMDNAMVEYSKEPRPRLRSLAELSAWCEDNGIYFMDYEGNMVFFDK